MRNNRYLAKVFSALFFVLSAPTAMGADAKVEKLVASLIAQLNQIKQERVGMIEAYAGSEIPDTYLACDGSSVSVSQYPTLFQKIGYLYGGSGDTFKLPDLRGQFLRGWNANDATKPDTGRALGSSQGFATSMTGVSASTNRVSDSSIKATDTVNSYGVSTGGRSWTSSRGNIGIPSIWQGSMANDGGTYAWGSGNTPNLGHGSGRHLYLKSAGGSWSTTLSGSTETRPNNVSVQFIIKAE